MDCFYNILCYITQLSNSRCLNLSINWITLQLDFRSLLKKVQVGKDQEKAQSEKDSHSKNRGGKKPN